MSSNWFFIVLEISTIACGLVAGVFLTFSDFVMRSLDVAKTSAGVEVMQVINREVFKSVFITLLLGWSVISALMFVYAWINLVGVAAQLVMVGSAVYVIGVFVVSMVFNVPMNNRLDVLQFSGSEAASYWNATYMPRWTFWNYIRAISSAISATCFMVAAVTMATI